MDNFKLNITCTSKTYTMTRTVGCVLKTVSFKSNITTDLKPTTAQRLLDYYFIRNYIKNTQEITPQTTYGTIMSITEDLTQKVYHFTVNNLGKFYKSLKIKDEYVIEIPDNELIDFVKSDN